MKPENFKQDLHKNIPLSITEAVLFRGMFNKVALNF